MFLGIRKKYWYYLAGTLVMAATVIFVNYSPLFDLQEVRCQGPDAKRLKPVTEGLLNEAGNLFRLEGDSFLEKALEIKGISRVSFKLSPPHAIIAEVNRFEPVARVWNGTDRMPGIDCYCRLVPYDQFWNEYDLPVLTGLKVGKMFEAPDDYRLMEVIAALQNIKDEQSELYNRIAEVNFSEGVYLNIFLKTSAAKYQAISHNLAGQLRKLPSASGLDNWAESGCYNLAYKDVVIRMN